MTVRVAATAWKIRAARRMRGDSAYFGHLHDFVSEAHEKGAEAIVLPELHVVELLQLRNDVKVHNAARYLAQYATAVEEWIDRISDLSGLIIVGGSHFAETPDGIFNVCAIGIPGSGTLLARKNNLTVYEREMWEVQRGQGLVQLPKSMGVTICYDAEFPESGRALADAGVEIQCVPAWTDSPHGAQRIRTACLARALENTMFVAQAALVGEVHRFPTLTGHGSAAIYGPSLEPFPATGILAETELNAEGVLVADLDLDLLANARAAGTVRNWADRYAADWTVKPLPRSPDEPSNARGELN